MSAAVAVQFGFAMTPLWLDSAWPLISGMTRGTSGSCRKAEELSMTTGPAAAILGTHSRATADPAATTTRSRPRKRPASGSSRAISRPSHSSLRPADRWEVKSRRSSTGKARSERSRSSTSPTSPVAPTTPTFMARSVPPLGRRPSAGPGMG